ncbi:MAG: dTDP-4-dehydrorhamnose 3,5-epimerase family protein [Acetobacteraceae bacterium]|nr:dTDP-4-dehydrorhamnose 3,5-epimerase family protein [Acetobacteraceae bacterium]
MQFEPTTIEGLIAVRLQRHEDERGSFARLFCTHEFAAKGLVTAFVQESLSVTRLAGTIRGMHYQRPPQAEVKFVRCVRGAVYDVVADLRPESSSYLRWQGFHLSAENDLALYIPKGCAHGFQSLKDNSEILYHMDTPYNPFASDGFRYDDPTIEISWPRPIRMIAEKDLAWPALSSR